MRLFSRREIVAELRKLGHGEYCADAISLATDELYNLLPAESVSTLECAEQHRYFRTPTGDGKFLWERDRTPYLVEVMEALDDEDVREVIMPKPGRSGGTAAFECYEFKLMRFGPMTDMLIYLGSDSEVDSYCDKGFRYLFEDHPEIQAKIGKGRSDDKLKAKKVAGRSVEVLPANKKTVTGRQAGWMRIDEIDTFERRLCATMLEQSRIRGRQLGNWRKVGITSHPDRGWTMGVAQAWLQSSKGIFIWQCPNCAGYGSPYPTTHWPDVPRFKIDYDRLHDGAPVERCVALAARSAVMRCPHCGSGLDDKQRFMMIDEGRWMHKGQTLDISAGIIGEPDANPARGFWIHGLMVKQVTNAELARDLEGAIAHQRATGKTDKLREVLAKVFGEVFDGAGASGAVDAAQLLRRSKGATDGEDGVTRFSIGQFPRGPRFIVAAVDVGHRKFDVSFRGFDLENRSWQLDRLVLRQRRWADGMLRDIAPSDRQEDWDVLYEAVLDRLFPMVADPGLAMPVAAVAIDCGDGNTMWKAREFARQSILKGYFWGQRGNPWSKVRLIRGHVSAKAPELPKRPSDALVDEAGKVITPTVKEYVLGVHRLKSISVERLAISDGGPGQCYFAEGISSDHFEEYFGERLIDDKWERHGPNESLDLFGYEEAVRQMLKPERADINWNAGTVPPWARPVPVNLEGGDQRTIGEVPQHAPSPSPEPAPALIQRFKGLNRPQPRN